MTENDYSGVLEPWKVRLTISRARRMGFRDARLDDALQEVLPLVAQFTFDPAKANGQTEAAMLAALVSRRLSNTVRCERRTSAREARCAPVSLICDDMRQTEMSCDVREVLQCLSSTDQRICSGLSNGETQLDIAAALGVSREVVRTRIDHIRLRFLELGLDGWVCGEVSDGKDQQ